MSDFIVDTGDPTLDEALKGLHECLATDCVQELVSAARDGTLTAPLLESVLPDTWFQLANILFYPKSREQILFHGHKAREQIEYVAQLVESKLREVLESPLSKQRLSALQGRQAVVTNSIEEAERVISGFTTQHGWMISEQGIAPFVRIFFQSKSQRILLDSTFGWDNLFFLARAMVETIHQGMSLSSQFSYKSVFTSPFADNLGRELRTLKSALDEVFTRAPKFGIPVEAPPPPAPKEV